MDADHIVFLVAGLSFLVGGLIYWKVFGKVKIDDPVPGYIDITSSSIPSNNAYSQSFSITGVLVVEGMPAQAIDYRGMCKSSKHPYGRMRLPVTASRSNPSKFNVEWKQVLTTKERAIQRAQAQAMALNNSSQQAPRQ